MTRPAVSQHLRVLADAGLVRVRPEGTQRLYRSRPEKLAEVVSYLDEMWSAGLRGLTMAAEREERTRRETVRGRKRR
jgi:DNA-binding transcriptional ArsR family regulator